jgi:DNA-binding MarR family transcriptional regulator
VRNGARGSAIRTRRFPSERKLVGIVSEIRRLSRTITVPLEREHKRAGYPMLESCEVLREIRESGDVHLTSADLQTRLSVPQHRMSQLIDRLAKEGYVEREKTTPDARSHVVVITDLGRLKLDEASSVISAAVRRFFYRKKRK